MTHYRRLHCGAKVQMWLTLLWWGFVSVRLFAVDDAANPIKGGPLVTWPNIFGAIGLAVTAGTVWQQWKTAQRQIEDLQKAVTHLREIHLPTTYLRQDVFNQWREGFEQDRRRHPR